MFIGMEKPDPLNINLGLLRMGAVLIHENIITIVMVAEVFMFVNVGLNLKISLLIWDAALKV
jgi:hypothetical protein